MRTSAVTRSTGIYPNAFGFTLDRTIHVSEARYSPSDQLAVSLQFSGIVPGEKRKAAGKLILRCLGRVPRGILPRPVQRAREGS